jgi:hypothetical protein
MGVMPPMTDGAHEMRFGDGVAVGWIVGVMLVLALLWERVRGWPLAPPSELLRGWQWWELSVHPLERLRGARVLEDVGATLGSGAGVGATAGIGATLGSGAGVGVGAVVGASVGELVSHIGEGVIMETLGGAEISEGISAGGSVGT